MGAIITDLQIQTYLQERKIIDDSFPLTLRDSDGFKIYRREIISINKNIFKIIARQSQTNKMNFSIILGVILPTKQLFRLKRYNGNYHSHNNQLVFLKMLKN